MAISMIPLMSLSLTTPALATVPTPRSEQWWLHQWRAKEKIWPLSRGQGVTVAVLDGGVDARVLDLAGRLLPGGDTAGGGTDGLQDMDGREHGTHVAAVIAAHGRGTGLIGVAPESRILSIRANNNTIKAGSDDNLGRAIRSAVRQGAKVINISLASSSDTGYECEPPLQHAIDEALQHDVIVIAGAGNNNHERNVPFKPATCPGVLAVGSIDVNGRSDHYSQPQPYVAVAAPGVDITSVSYASFRPKGFVDKRLRGTSYATAIVSGVVALLRARYPRMPARELLRRITGTAKDIGPRGRDIKSGFGAICPYEALTAQLPANIPSPVYEAWEKSRRERALSPLPERTRPSVPDVVPLRTRVIQTGVVAAALLFAGTGAATTAAFIMTRRRARNRLSPPYAQSRPGTNVRK
jgi:type VII secretion-associated serine protease mycosin